MRTIDLDLAREVRGYFKFGGKTYKIMEPTIGQLISHSNESESFSESVKPFLDKEGRLSSEGMRRHNEWLLKEVNILAPDIPIEVVEGMTYDQRTAVVRMIFGIDDEKKTPESRQVNRQQQKKKKQKV